MFRTRVANNVQRGRQGLGMIGIAHDLMLKKRSFTQSRPVCRPGELSRSVGLQCSGGHDYNWNFHDGVSKTGLQLQVFVLKVTQDCT